MFKFIFSTRLNDILNICPWKRSCDLPYLSHDCYAASQRRPLLYVYISTYNVLRTSLKTHGFFSTFSSRHYFRFHIKQKSISIHIGQCEHLYIRNFHYELISRAFIQSFLVEAGYNQHLSSNTTLFLVKPYFEIRH